MIVMRQMKRWARVPVRAMVAVVAAPPCSDAGGSLPVEMWVLYSVPASHSRFYPHKFAMIHDRNLTRGYLLRKVQYYFVQHTPLLESALHSH